MKRMTHTNISERLLQKAAPSVHGPNLSGGANRGRYRRKKLCKTVKTNIKFFKQAQYEFALC